MIDGAAVVFIEPLQGIAELWVLQEGLTDRRRTIAGGVQLCYPAWVRRLNAIQHLIVRRKRNVELRHVLAISRRGDRGTGRIDQHGVWFQRLNVSIKTIRD